MNDEAHRSEQERRELAQRHAGEVVEGSGRAVTPRRLGQMVSLRLEPGLAEALRNLADRRGISLSELLRESAILMLESERTAATESTFTWRIVSAPTVPTSMTPASSAAASG